MVLASIEVNNLFSLAGDHALAEEVHHKYARTGKYTAKRRYKKRSTTLEKSRSTFIRKVIVCKSRFGSFSQSRTTVGYNSKATECIGWKRANGRCRVRR